MPEPIPPPPTPPPLRVDLPLPPWRYLPGVGPHPLREGGHGGAGLPEHAPPALALARGLDLLDHRFPWEAHEAFETAWHALPRGTVHRRAAAGLVKVAAALVRAWCGDRRAATRLLERASEDLGDGGAPEGLDVDDLLERARRFVDGGDWPRISGA